MKSVPFFSVAIGAVFLGICLAVISGGLNPNVPPPCDDPPRWVQEKFLGKFEEGLVVKGSLSEEARRTGAGFSSLSLVIPPRGSVVVKVDIEEGCSQLKARLDSKTSDLGLEVRRPRTWLRWCPFWGSVGDGEWTKIWENLSPVPGEWEVRVTNNGENVRSVETVAQLTIVVNNPSIVIGGELVRARGEKKFAVQAGSAYGGSVTDVAAVATVTDPDGSKTEINLRGGADYYTGYGGVRGEYTGVLKNGPYEVEVTYRGGGSADSIPNTAFDIPRATGFWEGWWGRFEKSTRSPTPKFTRKFSPPNQHHRSPVNGRDRGRSQYKT